MRSLVLTGLVLCFCTWTLAQQPPSEKGPGQNQRSSSARDRDKEAGESSSRDTKIDLSPPKDDAKNHPESGAAIADADTGSSDDTVQEFHAWNPHKAIKDIEVGDYYFKRKNYHAALDRYQEALQFKPNDAIANFRSAECYAKLNDPEKARTSYEQYLKILPHGPLAEEAQKALTKLAKSQTSPNSSQANP